MATTHQPACCPQVSLPVFQAVFAQYEGFRAVLEIVGQSFDDYVCLEVTPAGIACSSVDKVSAAALRSWRRLWISGCCLAQPPSAMAPQVPALRRPNLAIWTPSSRLKAVPPSSAAISGAFTNAVVHLWRSGAFMNA